MALMEVKNLEMVYDDGEVKTPALRGVSFDIEQGEFVAVMGASGSGKSTLLHILGFLDKQTSGEYRFDGKTIDNYTKTEVARVRNKKMGFVFQAFNLLPRTTVFENVKLPLCYSGIKESLWKERVEKAVSEVGLTHRIKHETFKLSGGERQRVAIARALINHPQVIFADEPTGNLDSNSGSQIMGLVEKLHQKGHTILLITHESYTAEYAQRIITLRDGKVESDRKVAKQRTNANNSFSK